MRKGAQGVCLEKLIWGGTNCAEWTGGGEGGGGWGGGRGEGGGGGKCAKRGREEHAEDSKEGVPAGPAS